MPILVAVVDPGNFTKDVPDIITAAAKSQLGIFALMIVVLSLLAFAFFRNANQYVKMAIFFSLFAGVVVFAIAITNEANNTPISAPSSPAPMPSTMASSTPISRQTIQKLWGVVIYQVEHSLLVQSYVPDQGHAAFLLNAIRDNENVSDLIQNFGQQVQDPIIQKWLMSVNGALMSVPKDLRLVDKATITDSDVSNLLPNQRESLRAAEYNRVQLLDALAQISKYLEMSAPNFPNSAARTIDNAQ